MRKAWARVLAIVALSLCAVPLRAVEMSNRYRSPRNPERKVRASTELIVLHTTEAPARSSLNKVSERGECHFCVTEEGSIYRIVDRDREAFHAGRSMWNGREDVDKYSIGIECVGYHNKAMPMVQVRAIRALVKELQAMYRITDDRVVCHSHVAYGMPNRWQKRRHRGRKRCGMLFAMPSMRRLLGLKSRPGGDADTRAGRLSVGDEYLRQVLYGRVDTMAKYYSGVSVTAEPPESNIFAGIGSIMFWHNSTATSPTSTRSNVARSTTVKARPAVSRTASRTAGTAKKATGATKKAASQPMTIARLKAGGWRKVGVITLGNTPKKLAGAKWNAASTYYTIRDKVVPGNRLDAAHVEKGTSVWVK